MQKSRIAERSRPWGARGEGGPLAQPWRIAVLLAVCAALFFGAAVSSIRRESATFDEPVYVIGGLAYDTIHDFTMKDDAPPLIGYLAGISPSAHGLSIPGGALGFTDSFGHEYPYATRVLYQRGVDADRILFGSRMAIMIPFGILLLLTAILWTTEMFGTAAGAVAGLLAALCPNLIAHGGIVAADFACAATVLFAGYMIWRAAGSRPDVGGRPAAGGVAGRDVAGRPVAGRAGRPARSGGRDALLEGPLRLDRPATGRLIAAGFALGLALSVKFTSLILLPTFGAVLALSAWKRGGPPAQMLACFARELGIALAPAAAIVCLIYGLPPRPGLYFQNLSGLYRNVQPGFAWYLFGRFHATRPVYYYLATLLVKASVPVLVLGIGSLFRVRKRSAGPAAEIALFLPAVLMFVAASFFGISVGIRHILLILPVLAISAGRWVPDEDVGALIRRRSIWPVGALLVWLAISSALSWPHYIPYFNELAGGRRNGPSLLDDSNVDWGQDLKALPGVLDRHGIREVRLSYFGTADPAWYGIPGRAATPAELAERSPGVYAISRHNAIRMRRAGLDWPSRERPLDVAGTSILLFRIGAEDSGEVRSGGR